MLKLTNKTNKLQRFITNMARKHDEQTQEIRELAAKAEVSSRPRMYVTNRRTKKLHKALTFFAEVGPEAQCYCSFAYGKSSVRTSTTLDETDPKNICDASLPEGRMRLS